MFKLFKLYFCSIYKLRSIILLFRISIKIGEYWKIERKERKEEKERDIRAWNRWRKKKTRCLYRQWLSPSLVDLPRCIISGELIVSTISRARRSCFPQCSSRNYEGPPTTIIPWCFAPSVSVRACTINGPAVKSRSHNANSSSFPLRTRPGATLLENHQPHGR